ncbi:MAG: hypothetical protein HYV09_12505 [Deltaproteobacteria bacterium]|nr:hypothetical protein [Deltaproteobacteria bacterium]
MHRPVSRTTVLLFAVLLSALLAACARRPNAPAPHPEPIAAPAKSPCTASKERTIGEGHVVGNLTVYPITSCAQADVGPIVTLDEALEKGTAIIREVEGGGSVNTLVIENKGAVPVFVLAGTIVKGGRQDRQIGQDYLIGGKDKSDVDAFCVEHGRWNESRDGEKTGGVFRVADVIATSKVRAAGQYEKDQGKVWSKVAAANKAHAKAPPSETLLATVDDAALVKEREALAERLERALATVAPRESLVGFAYALDGEIKGARWFAHHRLWAMHEKKLLRSVALEATTAIAEAKASGKPLKPSAPPPPPSAVETFVASVETGEVKEERETKAENVNEYQESAKAFGSKMKMKTKPSSKSSGAKGSPAKKALSGDVTAK